MKYFIFIAVLVGLMACKGSNKEKGGVFDSETIVADKALEYQFPEKISKVFQAHGGMANWKSKGSLVFKIGEEIHTINLHSRMDRIDGHGYSMGFDGSRVWLQDSDSLYKGDPVFYHNLMSYFYNMPFVLGDKGIVYGQTEDLQYEGMDYPGISVSFNSGVGTSPKDQYYLHYDPNTFKMAWLGYTVSYRTGERSNKVNWIGYHDWINVDGLSVPKAITWYNYEGRTIIGARNRVEFDGIELSGEEKHADFFLKPENAVFVEAKSGQ